MAECDQLVRLAIEGGDEKRGFVGLGAAVGEKDLVQPWRRHRPQALGQFDLGADQEERAGVDDAVELLLDRVVDLRDGMARGDGGNAAEEVEVLLARAVVDILPFATSQLDGVVVEEPDAREQTLLVPAQQIVRVVRLIGLNSGGVFA
jgi:hypothetical protein